MVEWLIIRQYNENVEKCFVVFITQHGLSTLMSSYDIWLPTVPPRKITSACI